MSRSICTGQRKVAADGRESERGDPACPLWGLAMRFSQEMCLHRDPGAWDHPDDMLEERRIVLCQHAANAQVCVLRGFRCRRLPGGPSFCQ